jgi:hypothetical protein
MIKSKKYMTSKRNLFILIVLLSLTLTGCGDSNAAQEAGSTTSPNTSATEQPVEANNSEQDHSTTTNEISISDEIKQLEDSGIAPVGVGILKFLESKTKSNDILEPFTEQITISDPMAAMALMPISFADMTVLPLTILSTIPSAGNNVWEGELLSLFKGTGRVELKGSINTFTIEGTEESGTNGKMTITGEYDMATDSLRAEFVTDGNENHVFEFVASGDGYVSQLYSSIAGEVHIIKNAFNSSSLYSSVIPANAKPESIYQKNIKVGEDFVKNETLMVSNTEGKGYGIFDGQKIMY